MRYSRNFALFGAGVILLFLYFSPQKNGPTRFPSSTSSYPPEPEDKTNFDQDRWFFQDDVQDTHNPNFNTHKLCQYAPHNYHGPGHETFATYLATRNGSMQDPYFLAAQQLAYRILWDPRSKSEKYPLTVFVAPFIPTPQREMLQAAGALVRELDLLSFKPSAVTKERWRDMFSKLNMWAQIEFSRIAFLDVDAHPLENIDALLSDDICPTQQCNAEALPQDDKPFQDEICTYTFSAAEVDTADINAGVLVFSPNKAMHTYLLRESSNSANFDSAMMEQGFLNYAFRRDGPFPYARFDKEWNGFYTKADEEGLFKVIHEKLWALKGLHEAEWAWRYWGETWEAMLRLYEGGTFEGLRMGDGTVGRSNGGL